MALLRQFQTYMIVTLITALIWLFAEGQDVQRYDREQLTVQLAVPAGWVVAPSQITLRGVQFQGATAKISELKQTLSAGLSIRLDADGTLLQPGQMEIDVVERLRASVALATGVNVLDAQPEQVNVLVDRMETREANVIFQAGDIQLIDAPEMEPPRVSISAPQLALNRAGPDGQGITVRAEPVTPLRDLEPEVEQTVRARVVPPDALVGEPLVKINPQEVRVTLAMAKRQESITLANVPVWVVAPPSELSRYSVQLEDESRFIRDVTVTGPILDIQKIANEQTRVVAMLTLNAEALDSFAGKETVVAPVSFNLPPQFKVEAPSNTARFTVSRRGG